MKISIPELSLILLVGPSGCGKSSFGRKHFLSTEVVSSDFCRALVSDNETTSLQPEMPSTCCMRLCASGSLVVV